MYKNNRFKKVNNIGRFQRRDVYEFAKETRLNEKKIDHLNLDQNLSTEVPDYNPNLPENDK